MIQAQQASGQGGPPVTMYTSAAAQALHDAIAHEPDPGDKQQLAQCLRIVLQIQAKNSQGQQQGPSPQQQALAGQIGSQG